MILNLLTIRVESKPSKLMIGNPSITKVISIYYICIAPSIGEIAEKVPIISCKT